MMEYTIEGTEVKGVLQDVAEAFQDANGNLSLVLEDEYLAKVVMHNLNDDIGTDKWFVCSWIDGRDRQVCYE